MKLESGYDLDEIKAAGTYIPKIKKETTENEHRVFLLTAYEGWIPCSKMLPEQGERVIVAIFGSDMIMPNEGETLQDAIERSRKDGYITVGFIGSDGWYGADWFPLMVHPSYWMPLPEPPEGGADDAT